MHDGIGASVLRKEDKKFLTGKGRYVDDLSLPGALWAHIVRASVAHAVIRGIDATAAQAAPGVAAVFTGADMEADGVGPMTCMWQLSGMDGKPMAEPPRLPLARGKVRHVGEPVAVVIADTMVHAADAAELLAIDYEELPAVVGAQGALASGAAQLHDEAPGNIVTRFARGNKAAVDAAFAKAPHTVTVTLVNNRLVCAAIEPRAAAARLEDNGSLTLWSSTQAPHHIRRHVTEELGLPEMKLRVIAPDVGGGFGTKGKHHPEETIVTWAARRLEQPVRWTATRSESFLSDAQGRDHETTAELAFDNDGRFLAVRVITAANIGAYISTFGVSIPSVIYTTLLAGVYLTPAVYVEVTTVFTNSVPTDAYRGAGRPEACYVLDRLADSAARHLGLDRAEIRRRNLIPSSAMPYRTPIGPLYDCGDFPRLLARALEVSDYASIEARRAEAKKRGKHRGIGMAMYVESSGVAPSKMAGAMGARLGLFESAEIRVDATGGVTALLGTHNHGQGHATSFAQVLKARLGVPLDMIEIVEGDTALVPYGTGTFGSRSMAVGGAALVNAAEKIVIKAKRIAGHLLEAADSDLTFNDGIFTVTGTDKKVTFLDVTRAAHHAHNLPPGTEPGLHESAFFDPVNFAFSAGCHVAEVEIDPETGVIQLVRHIVVDDIGTVINPMIVHGQVQGGLAQGIGQAMFEHVAWDAANGQVLSGSFMDYALPRASDLPFFHTETDESQPTPINPLGAKGCGESGTIGAPSAIVSAVLDALAPLGITTIDMPLTPGRIWEAIQTVRS